jgi:hypothetical protein
LLALQKPLKETHLLPEAPPSTGFKPVTPIPVKETPGKFTARQSTIDFESAGSSSSNPQKEPVVPGRTLAIPGEKPLNTAKIDYTRITDEEADYLEKVPAYLRKQQSDPRSLTKPVEYSGYSVSPDPKKKIIIRETNNPWIHKNVD